jgi:hypothetical protein
LPTHALFRLFLSFFELGLEKELLGKFFITNGAKLSIQSCDHDLEISVANLKLVILYLLVT